MLLPELLPELLPVLLPELLSMVFRLKGKRPAPRWRGRLWDAPDAAEGGEPRYFAVIRKWPRRFCE
jgi:hypothetical protein